MKVQKVLVDKPSCNLKAGDVVLTDDDLFEGWHLVESYRVYRIEPLGIRFVAVILKDELQNIGCDVDVVVRPKGVNDSTDITKKIDEVISYIKGTSPKPTLLETANLLESKQRHINEIMDWFNFSKVAKAMEALEWTWHDAFEGIPSEPELRMKARELMNDLDIVKTETSTGFSHTGFISTGGFVVEAGYDDKGQLDGISLRFELTDWDSYNGN